MTTETSRHNVMIGASFAKNSRGKVICYYVVKGSARQFFSLTVAKEIAEGIAARELVAA